MASAEEVTNNNTGLTDPQPLENENTSKRCRTVRPLPSFLTLLTLSNLPEYEVITEKELVKDDDNPGATKELDHAVAMKKHQSIHQVRHWVAFALQYGQASQNTQQARGGNDQSHEGRSQFLSQQTLPSKGESKMEWTL